MQERTVWVVDPDPVFSQQVVGVLSAAGIQVMDLGDFPAGSAWGEQDIVLVSIELLPVPEPPQLIVGLVPPEEEHLLSEATIDQLTACVPRDAAWLPFLPGILRALHDHRDRWPAGLPQHPVLEQMEEGVVIENPQGFFTFVSEGVARMLGRRREDLIGRHFTEIVYPDDRELAVGETSKRRHGIASHYEVRLRGFDGAAVPVWVSPTPMFENGEYTGVMAIFRDLSREKNLQIRFQAFQKIATAVGERRDLPDILLRAGEAFRALLEGASIVLFLVTEGESGSLRPLIVQSDDPVARLLERVSGRPLSEIRFPFSMLPVEWRIRIPKGYPCFTLNPAELMEQTIGPAATAFVGAEYGPRGLIVLPLRSGGLFQGLIVVTLDRDYVRQEDLDLAMAVARLVATALESQSLLKQARRRVYSLDRLFELTRAMGQSMELGELATIAARQFIQAFNVMEASISMWDTAMDAVRVMVDIRHNAEKDVFESLTGQEVYHLDDYPATRRVMERQLPVQILRSELNADAAELAYMDRVGGKTLIILPLVHKGKCIGIVELEDSSQEKRLSMDQMGLAMTLAGQLAATLENARLFKETQHQAVQLRTSAEVARHATAILDVEELLSQSVDLIRDRFDFYYVGLFLVDATGEWMELRACAGEASQRLLEARHRLRIGDNSMIGWCASHQKARIALDAGKDGVRLENPFLPETRSEIALPLVTQGRLMGAMSIQSTRSADFSPDDITILQAMADQLAIAIENAYLHEEQQRRLAEQAALYEIGRAIAAVLDQQELIEVVYGQINRFTDASHLYVALWERETDTIHVPALIEGDNRFYDREVGWEGLVGWVLRHGEPLVIGDLAEAVLPPGVDPIIIGEESPRSLVLVPLMVGDHLIGVFSVQSRRIDVYDQRSVNFITAVASQIAVAVENARLYEREYRRATHMSLLNVVARQTNAIMAPDDLLSTVAGAIYEHFGYDSVVLMLVESDSYLRIAGQAGEGQRKLSDDYCQSINQGIMGWVARHGKPLLANDTAEQPLYFNPISDDYWAGAELAVPLKIRKQTIGVLDLQRRESYSFDELDLVTAQTLADQVTVALQNARLFTEARQQAEELAALNAVAVRLGRSLDLQEVLETAIDSVIRVLDVDASAISLVDEEAGDLNLCAQRGLHFSHLGMRIPLDKGMSAHVISTGETLIAGEVGRDPRLAVPEFAREKVQSMLLVPMASRGRVVGVLSAMSHSPRAFTPREIALLESMANQIGTAAENAQLFQAVSENVISLELAYRRLKEADQLKDELIQNVSHELRTPLTFVKGYVQLLLEEELGPLNPSQLKSLEVVSRKTDHLNRLIGDFITLETVSPSTLDTEQMCLGHLARAAVEGCGPAAADAGLNVELRILGNLPLVHVDPSRVSQVFDNLLSNAIKFSPDGGKITVRLVDNGDSVRAEISDTGIGIPSDKVPRVFERFYQVDGSARRRFGGAGLGLTIVKRIVEAHGGQVGVESRSGEGSTFYFTIPVSTTDAETVQYSSHPPR
jgi:PAS domain S-box-containing protein